MYRGGSRAAFAEAAATVGSVQIRNVVTIGGSVANDSPCGDVLPALLVLGSTATVLDQAGVTRRRPVAELLGGSGQTRLSCGEVITELEFPALGPAERSAFARVASRSTVSVAKLSLAIIVAYAALDGRLRDARVALGARREGGVERRHAGTGPGGTSRGFDDLCIVCSRMHRSLYGALSLVGHRFRTSRRPSADWPTMRWPAWGCRLHYRTAAVDLSLGHEPVSVPKKSTTPTDVTASLRYSASELPDFLPKMKEVVRKY